MPSNCHSLFDTIVLPGTSIFISHKVVRKDKRKMQIRQLPLLWLLGHQASKWDLRRSMFK